MSPSFSWVRRRVEPIAIDFGTRVIRMLQLACHQGQGTVIAYAQRVLAPGTPIDDREARVQAVREMLREGGFSGRDVTTALPWHELHIRNLRIPSMPESDAEEVVRFEASERFGLDPERAEVRFLVAGDVRQGTEIRQEVIALAADGPVVDAHIGMLAEAGLRPVAIDALPCAVFRSFQRFLKRDEDSHEINVFVDMGYSATRVVVSSGPHLVFFKSIPIGGESFDERVAAELNVNIQEAADLRVRLQAQCWASVTGEVAEAPVPESVSDQMQRAVLDAVRPLVDQLGKEIGLCLRYCSVTFRGLRPDAITVVGGEAGQSDVLRLLSDQLTVPLQAGKPMRNIAADGVRNGQNRRTGQPEWATVLGLAWKAARVSAEAAA